jgi:hypothetical protein
MIAEQPKLGDRIKVLSPAINKTGRVTKVSGPDAYVPDSIEVRFSYSFAVTLKPAEWQACTKLPG